MALRHSLNVLKSGCVFVCLVFICRGREWEISNDRRHMQKNSHFRRTRGSHHSLGELLRVVPTPHLDPLATFATFLVSAKKPVTSQSRQLVALRGGSSRPAWMGEESMDAGRERTFIMIKPDGVQRALVGEITNRFERRGFQLKAMKLYRPSEQLLREHYKEHVDKVFFPGLLKYMLSGPVICMVWEGDNVVKMGRQMLGATNPKESLPGTIRGDFAIETQRNIIHGSDSPENAQREIELWFSEDELCDWESHSTDWIYK